MAPELRAQAFVSGRPLWLRNANSIEPRKGDKRYVRRGDNGRFHEVDDVGRSLSRDVKQRAKTVAKLGQGDKGDRKRQG